VLDLLVIGMVIVGAAVLYLLVEAMDKI